MKRQRRRGCLRAGSPVLGIPMGGRYGLCALESGCSFIGEGSGSDPNPAHRALRFIETTRGDWGLTPIPENYGGRTVEVHPPCTPLVTLQIRAVLQAQPPP